MILRRLLNKLLPGFPFPIQLLGMAAILLIIYLMVVASVRMDENLPPTTSTSAPDEWVVSDVVDGDTIDVLHNDKEFTIRIIGIDTPERGDCGFTEATDYLSQLLPLGIDVSLFTGARDDTDRYGRLIRYVEVDDNDVGLAQINAGYAIARYDSRDGYGRHAREDAYIAADKITTNFTCEAAP